MSETIYHGDAVHRRGPGRKESPPTGELTQTARDIVRLLEGTDGQALLTELVAGLGTVPHAEVERAVQQLVDAGIVATDSGFGETVVSLRDPFTEVIESRRREH